MGRPLVANRTSWVVSVDRSVLDKMTDRPAGRAAATGSPAPSAVPVGTHRGALLTCGEPGSVAGTCWNGSPYQPVPVAVDVRAAGRAARSWSSREDFPAVLAEQQSVRAYPRPYGINLAHVLGYLSPITEDELDAGRRPTTTSSVNGASVGRPGRRREAVRQVAARRCPATSSVAVDSMGRVLGDDGEVAGAARRHPGHLDRRPGAGRRRAAARRRRSSTARQTYDEVTAPQLRRRLRRRGRDGGQDRPDRRDGQPADVRPGGLGRRHHPEAARAGSTPSKAGDPAARAAPPRASSPPARPGSRS